MKKLLAIAMATMLAVSLFAGCGEKQPDTSTEGSTTAEASSSTAGTISEGQKNLRFMWWGGETRHKATVEALDLYTANNPDVKIDYEYGGFSGYFDKLMTQLAGNNAPDIVQLSYTNVIEYVVRDQLYPLNEFIDNGTLDVSEINKSLTDIYSIDDKLYAIPSGVNVQLLFYNKDLFDKYSMDYPTSGMTMDEYYATAKAITDAARDAGVENLWGTAPFQDAFDVNFQRTLLDFGGQLWTDDLTTAAFNSPEGIAAMEYIKKPLDEGYAIPPEVSVGNPDGVTPFALGQVAMEINNATSTASYADTGDFELGLELAPFGNTKKAIWYQASQVFSITKQSKHPAEAAKIINFMVNDTAAGDILGYERGIPPNDSIRAASTDGKSEIEKKQLELVDGAAEYMGDGVPMPFPPGYLEIHTEYNRLFEAYSYGQKTAEEALADLETMANKTIGKFQE